MCLFRDMMRASVLGVVPPARQHLPYSFELTQGVRHAARTEFAQMGRCRRRVPAIGGWKGGCW